MASQRLFWSSADLTGNQTEDSVYIGTNVFWSSADLTGNQTMRELYRFYSKFWSSADLTGNQTPGRPFAARDAYPCAPLPGKERAGVSPGLSRRRRFYPVG